MDSQRPRQGNQMLCGKSVWFGEIISDHCVSACLSFSAPHAQYSPLAFNTSEGYFILSSHPTAKDTVPPKRVCVLARLMKDTQVLLSK